MSISFILISLQLNLLERGKYSTPLTIQSVTRNKKYPLNQKAVF